MIEIPAYIQYFVLIGIALLVLIIPIRIVWSATRSSREAGRKNRESADRLREKFSEVQFHSGTFSCDRVSFRHEDRKMVLYLLSPRKLILKVEGAITPAFHAYIKSRGWWNGSWKFFWESLRFLRRFKTYDALLDEKVTIYSSNAFGHYLRELAMDSIPLEGKPKGIAESMVVLSNLPGVKKIRFTMSPSAGMRLHLKLTTEDLFYRPDELETATHHLLQLHKDFVMY